jgi:hypothetical protein
VRACLQSNETPIRFFLAPDDTTVSATLLCRNDEIELRGNSDSAHNLKYSAAFPQIANSAIDATAAKVDHSAFKDAMAR